MVHIAFLKTTISRGFFINMVSSPSDTMGGRRTKKLEQPQGERESEPPGRWQCEMNTGAARERKEPLGNARSSSGTQEPLGNARGSSGT